MLNTHYSRTLNNTFNERIKRDAKTCYQLLHELNPTFTLPLRQRYDFYTQLFGAENFSHSCVHGKGDEADYLTPFTLPMMNPYVLERLEAVFNDDKGLAKQAYQILAETLGTVSRKETTTCFVESTMVTHHSGDRFLFSYFPEQLQQWISVFMKREAAEALLERLRAVHGDNVKKEDEDRLPIHPASKEPLKSLSYNLPRYRFTKGDKGFVAYGRSTRGCRLHERDVLLSYTFNAKEIDDALTESVFMDCYLDQETAKHLIEQLITQLND